jgi:hypothetical protein
VLETEEDALTNRLMIALEAAQTQHADVRRELDTCAPAALCRPGG